MFGPVSVLQDEAIVHALYRQSTMAGTSWSGDEDCFFNKSCSVSPGMDEFTLQKRLVINNSASYVSFYFLVPLMSVIKCSLIYQCTSNHFGRYAIRCMSGKLSSFYVSWPKHFMKNNEVRMFAGDFFYRSWIVRSPFVRRKYLCSSFEIASRFCFCQIRSSWILLSKGSMNKICFTTFGLLPFWETCSLF